MTTSQNLFLGMISIAVFRITYRILIDNKKWKLSIDLLPTFSQINEISFNVGYCNLNNQ